MSHHRKLIDPAMKLLKKERAEYFSAIVKRLEELPQIEPLANIIYLVLKETMEMLPLYLPKEEMISLLYSFAKTHRERFNRLLFNSAFITNPRIIHQLTNTFVNQVVDISMLRYEEGEIDLEESSVHKFTWPAYDGEFPYSEEEED